MVKTITKLFSPELGVYDLKIGMQNWVLEFYKSGINDDLWLTVTYFFWHGHSKTPVHLNEKTLLQSNSMGENLPDISN